MVIVSSPNVGPDPVRAIGSWLCSPPRNPSAAFEDQSRSTCCPLRLPTSWYDEATSILYRSHPIHRGASDAMKGIDGTISRINTSSSMQVLPR